MNTINVALFCLIFIPISLLQIALPYLTRRTISFGITISEEVWNSTPVADMRKRYALLSTAFCLILGIAFGVAAIQMNGNTLGIAIAGFAIVLLIGTFALHLYFYGKMKALKASLPAAPAPGKTALSLDTSFRKQRLVMSGKWYLIHLAVIIACAVFALAQYDRIPEQIPMHYDLNGNVDRMEDKSIRLLLLPNLLQLFMTGLLLFINFIIYKSKQQLNPADPQESSRTNAAFRRRWSVFNFAMSLLLVMLFFFMQLTMIYSIDPKWIFPVALAVPILIIAGSIWLSFSTGQSGTRLARKSGAGGNPTAVPVDDDRHWKLGGSTYYNPNDPSLFIEKRVGIGWTVNFARPLAWVFVLAPFVIIALLLVFTS
ncbi:DUF1648 domain-containing protein [Paenibacillus physcomitrellae]|uniref:Membrane protein n=1 Tax=Paenibacillus physcomitrellae TaxID=1619311 RepID=A0ABQ1GU11_9BACL|nr:DUF5808 domain-containing protein [Paenibacillus physcomitrellae]GGA50085.1 membrane protein [Paenibacillus physcomitrellae]